MENNIIIKSNNLSFQNMIIYSDIMIPRGKVTFITGESGSGKSTLLKLINGTLPQSSGEIYYNGENTLESDSIKLRKEISLISQNIFLFPGSIKDNFIQFYEYRGLQYPTDEVIHEFLRLCCIPFSLDKDCSTMSGGERQRVYIAIFLSFEPKVIMLDEPTSALDNKNTMSVIENIILFCKEKNITVIIISHDKELIEEYAQNHIILKKEELA